MIKCDPPVEETGGPFLLCSFSFPARDEKNRARGLTPRQNSVILCALTQCQYMPRQGNRVWALRGKPERRPLALKEDTLCQKVPPP